MKTLPKIFFASLAFITLFSLSLKSSFAASAYISPSLGIIKEVDPLVSVYVESSATEPEIASAHIIITFPNTMQAVSITEGAFDSYIQKSIDANTNEISINAINNAGNYKSGKIKLASIKFEMKETSGQAQLTISSASEINGAGGEQLLTETINGVYSIELQSTDIGVETPLAEDDDTAVGSPVVPAEGTAGAVPATGGNDFTYYLIVSLALIALGSVTFLKAKKNELSRG